MATTLQTANCPSIYMNMYRCVWIHFKLLQIYVYRRRFPKWMVIRCYRYMFTDVHRHVVIHVHVFLDFDSFIFFYTYIIYIHISVYISTYFLDVYKCWAVHPAQGHRAVARQASQNWQGAFAGEATEHIDWASAPKPSVATSVSDNFRIIPSEDMCLRMYVRVIDFCNCNRAIDLYVHIGGYRYMFNLYCSLVLYIFIGLYIYKCLWFKCM